MRPLPILVGVLADVTRSRKLLLLENALLHSVTLRHSARDPNSSFATMTVSSEPTLIALRRVLE